MEAWKYPDSTLVRTSPSAKTKAEISGTWGEPPASRFSVRGATYLEDQVKVTSQDSVFTVNTIQILESPVQLYHATRLLPSLREFVASHPEKFFLIVNRVLPGPPYKNVITIAYRDTDSLEGVEAGFDKAFDEFVKGDLKARDSTFKYICKMEGAPWLVKKVVDGVGGQRPVIMGNGYLKQKHFSGANYVEVDVDVSSSTIAKGICSAVLSYSDRFHHNECFLVEGQRPDTLPERSLFCISFHYVAIEKASRKLSPEDVEAVRSAPSEDDHQSTVDRATEELAKVQVTDASTDATPVVVAADVPASAAAAADVSDNGGVGVEEQGSVVETPLEDGAQAPLVPGDQ